MVICKCCKFEYPKSKGKCDVCGMLNRFGEGVTDEMIQEEIEKIKRTYLGNTKIYFVKYPYEISENTAEDQKPDTMLLAQPITMEVGKPEWLEEEFDDIPTERKIQVDIIMERTEKGIKNEFSVSLQPEKENSFTKIGIVMTPGFCFRILGGDDNSYTESEEVSIKEKLAENQSV